MTFKDIQKVDENGELKYRKRRGDHYPINELPDQIGFLNSNRHHGVWTGAIWVAPHVASDMLALLLRKDVLYLTLHELRINRRRKIFGMSLQTNDPAEE